MTIGQWLASSATQFLNQAQVSQPKLEAELILASVLKTDRIKLHAHPEKALSEQEQLLANQWLEKRLAGFPLAYLTSKKEFYGQNFVVTPDVLIPRPESEAMVEAAHNFAKTILNPNILDLGTGSGAIGISLAQSLDTEHKSYSLTLADISSSALTIAQQNARRRLNTKAKFVTSDLLAQIDDQFDIILANLPYVNPKWKSNQNLKHEPALALFAKDNGLQIIKRLIKSLASDKAHCLAPSGKLFLELDHRQQKAVTDYLAKHDFAIIDLSDYLIVTTRETPLK